MEQGKQFAENEPRVYTESDGTVSSSGDSEELFRTRSLLPKREGKRVYVYSHTNEEGSAEGARVNVSAPEAYRHVYAKESDPGALFSYHRPKIDYLYATNQGKHVVPAALGAAHKHSVEQFGATPTHSEILTPFSKKVVDTAIERGVVAKNEDYDPKELSDFHKFQAEAFVERMAKQGEISPEDSDEMPHKEKQRLLHKNITDESHRTTSNLVGASKAVDEPEPPGSFKKYSDYGRNLLRRPEPEKPHISAVHPDQLKLF